MTVAQTGSSETSRQTEARHSTALQRRRPLGVDRVNARKRKPAQNAFNHANRVEIVNSLITENRRDECGDSSAKNSHTKYLQ